MNALTVIAAVACAHDQVLLGDELGRRFEHRVRAVGVQHRHARDQRFQDAHRGREREQERRAFDRDGEHDVGVASTKSWARPSVRTTSRAPAARACMSRSVSRAYGRTCTRRRHPRPRATATGRRTRGPPRGRPRAPGAAAAARRRRGRTSRGWRAATSCARRRSPPPPPRAGSSSSCGSTSRLAMSRSILRPSVVDAEQRAPRRGRLQAVTRAVAQFAKRRVPEPAGKRTTAAALTPAPCASDSAVWNASSPRCSCRNARMRSSLPDSPPARRRRGRPAHGSARRCMEQACQTRRFD